MAFLILFGLLLVAFLWLSIPPDPGSLASNPRPVTSYMEAVQRIQALQAEEGPEYNPVCRLIFMDHGQKTERVIVFIHGYTNCPEQFRQVGEMFFERGYNVLITPQPYMGLADRMNNEQERLTAEQLVAYTDEVIDIAQGLGEHITLAGLSGGGVMASWAAQQRSDLDLAVVIAPGLGYRFLPDFLTTPFSNLFRRLPNFYQWWDPINKLDIEPYYGYPRFSSRALAELLRLGLVVHAEACREAPLAGAILVITNNADLSVANRRTDQVVDCWQQHGFHSVRTFKFDASLRLEHDLIDPSQTHQRIDIVYPQLLNLIMDMGQWQR
jgi:carboxylesterase